MRTFWDGRTDISPLAYKDAYLSSRSSSALLHKESTLQLSYAFKVIHARTWQFPSIYPYQHENELINTSHTYMYTC